MHSARNGGHDGYAARAELTDWNTTSNISAMKRMHELKQRCEHIVTVKAFVITSF